MGVLDGEGDLLAAIEKSLASSKVDPYIAHEFSQHKGDADFNAGEFLVAMLARVSDPNITIEGVKILSGIGNILGMQAPFTSFPDLVAEKKGYLSRSESASWSSGIGYCSNITSSLRSATLHSHFARFQIIPRSFGSPN